MKLINRILFLLFAIIMVSCGPKKNEDPTVEIENLKKKIQEYNERILELESNMGVKNKMDIPVKAKPVVVDTLKKIDFKEYVDIQGTVDAEYNVLASPQMPGVVTSISVKVGDQVRKGSVLASLDGSTIRQGIEELKTGLSLSQTLYEKQKSLWDQRIGTEAQFLQAKNQKEQLEERLKTLQAQLALTTIKSPVDGVVDEIKLKIGEMASPGFAGIRVVNNNSLSVKAKVSDLYAGKIKKGDPVELFFPDLDKTVKSSISYSGQTVNLTTRTIMVESKLPGGSKDFRANQLVKMKINNGTRKNAVVIPTNLIQTSMDNEDYVLVAQSDSTGWSAKKKVIKQGASYAGNTLVESGLSEGEFIISSGYNDIVDGQKIKIQ